jgi:hypothetical protein
MFTCNIVNFSLFTFVTQQPFKIFFNDFILDITEITLS